MSLLEELKLQSEALWESVKQDLTFFGAIQTFSKNLAEFDYFEQFDIDKLLLYSEKIWSFFCLYNHKAMQHKLILNNNATALRIFKLSCELKNLPKEQLVYEIDFFKANSQLKPQSKSNGQGHIFIGHGRSKLWARLQIHLKDDLNLKILSYESESRTSETIINILDDFLNKASYAILILTAEDETSDGGIRARQNVIHEAGLFQGRLGFNQVVLLKQDKTEDFTNIDGLQYISFNGDKIEQTFYELDRTLKKLKIIK